MRASEQIKAVIAAIDDAMPHIAVADNARTERVKAQRELEMVKAELADHRAALERLSVDQIKAQEAHAVRLDAIRAEQTLAVQEMNIAKAKAQQDLERVTERVAEATARHNAILNGLELAMGQRQRVG